MISLLCFDNRRFFLIVVSESAAARNVELVINVELIDRFFDVLYFLGPYI
jgi:hypothetical protein